MRSHHAAAARARGGEEGDTAAARAVIPSHCLHARAANINIYGVARLVCMQSHLHLVVDVEIYLQHSNHIAIT